MTEKIQLKLAETIVAISLLLTILKCEEYYMYEGEDDFNFHTLQYLRQNGLVEVKTRHDGIEIATISERGKIYLERFSSVKLPVPTTKVVWN